MAAGSGQRGVPVFVHGMVLSDNASLAAYLPCLDIIEVCEVMKETDEDLFSRPMRRVR